MLDVATEVDKIEVLPRAVEWWRVAVVSVLLYAGNLCTFAAVRRGDVSMVTPVLGTKVVFVALGVLAISGASLSAGLWVAAGLATLGILVMSRSDLKHGAANGAAIGLCLLASLFFGLTDVLIAEWVPKYGIPLTRLALRLCARRSKLSRTPSPQR